MANFSTKLASTVSAAAIVASSMSASLVSAASEFLPYAEALAAKKVINQSTETGYRLNDQITRAELAKVAANLGGYTAVECTGKVFTDVNSSLGDLCTAIETLASAKVISTTSSTFRPTANVTRAEMTKMILGALAVAPVANGSHKFADVSSTLGDLEGFINAAADKGIVNKAMNFRPNATGSRGEVFKIAANAAGIKVEAPSNNNTNNTTATAGNVSVTLVGSAAAQYVPRNASSVKVGTVKLTATGGDVTVNTVTLSRSGLGEVRGLQASLAQNGVIVGNARTFNNTSQEVVVRLNNPIVLKNGASVDFDVLASLPSDGTSNSQHQFAITGVNGTATSAVTLGLLNTTSYEVKSVKASSFNTHDQRSGLTNVRVADLTIDGASGRDVTVHGFTLSKNSGNDLTQAINNVKVFRNGVEISTAKVAVTSDKIIVTGLGTKLPAGETAKYELRADTIYIGDNNGNNGKYTLYVANTEDIAASEDATGYATRTDASLPTEKTLTITGIKITTSLVDTKTKNIAPGSSGVNFLDGKMNSAASFEVLGYTLTAEVNGAAATKAQLEAIFSSLSFDVAGSNYDLLASTPNAGVFTYGNSDSFFVEAGKDVAIRVRGSVKSGVDTNTYKNVRFTFKTVRLKNVDSGNSFGHTSTDIAGNTINLKSSTLNLRGATVAAPSTKNISSSLNGVEIGRFALESKNADVRVAKVTVTNVAAANAIASFKSLADNASSFRIVDLSTNTEVDATKDISNDGKTLTFEFSPAVSVNKDTIKNFKLTVDTKSITDMGKKVKAQFEIKAADLSTDNGNVDSTTSTVSSEEYTTAISMPTLKLSAAELTTNSSVAKVTVENTDSDNNVMIKEMKLRVQARSTANNGGSVDFKDSKICLRNLGATIACGTGTIEAAAGGAVNGAVFAFTFTDAIDAGKLISTNSSTDFEVFMSNAPLWVAGDNVAVSIESAKYVYGETTTPTTETTETYVGVASASVVSRK